MKFRLLSFYLVLVLAASRLATGACGENHQSGPVVAVGAEWAQFGDYLEKFLSKTETEWEELIAKQIDFTPSGRDVVVRFTMDDRGHVVVPMSRDAGREYTLAAEAVLLASPQPLWTNTMKKVLGTRSQMVFTFNYHVKPPGRLSAP